MSDFRLRRKVEFRDTDAAGMAHFSMFPVWMEQTEHAFLRQLGFGVHWVVEGAPAISWPRASVQCDYLSPLRFEDDFDVRLCVARLGTKSVTYRYEFLRDETLIARGSIATVCCEWRSPGGLTSIVIPHWIREKLEPFVETDCNESAVGEAT
jgi:4-hydroxybenzoyl-CoA thioesterase/acyl-CoA thioester hydrolase